MTCRGFVFLEFPIQKNNLPGSSEFSAIRRKISYFLCWIVEWISPGINEHHKTHCLLVKCKTSTSGTSFDTELGNIPWENKMPYCTPMSAGEGGTQSRWQMPDTSLGGLLEGAHALWWGAQHKTIQTYHSSPAPPQLHTKAMRGFCLSNRMPLTHNLSICCFKTLEDFVWLLDFTFSNRF